MSDDPWIILEDVKAKTTPKPKPVVHHQGDIFNVTSTSSGGHHQGDIFNVTSTSILVDAVTSKPDVEVTIGSPILGVHDNDTSTRPPHDAFIGFDGGKKIHHLGNSTGMTFNTYKKGLVGLSV